MMQNKDEEIIKALDCCRNLNGNECEECPYERLVSPMGNGGCTNKLMNDTLDLINRQKAEIERLHKLQKPTEASGFKIEDGKVVFYTNMLNGYRHELKDLDEVVEELNLMLQEAYKTDEIAGYLRALQEQYKTAKSEAIKEFAERLNKHSVYVDDYDCFMVSAESIDNLVKEMTEPVKLEHNSLCETETFMGE